MPGKFNFRGAVCPGRIVILDRMSPRSLLASWTALGLILGTAACTVPITPGYRILKESREVQFVPEEPPELHVRSEYTLENSGTTDLTFVDVTFPDEIAYGRRELRVQAGGRNVMPASLPEEYQVGEPNTLRIPFDPVWRRKQKLQLVIDYNFRSPQDSGARITIGEANFHLGSRGWAPLPRPPKHFFAPYPSRPARMMYTVRVPSDFLVLARGKAAGRKKMGAETVYRFELRKGDLTPFVVAGRYVASSPERAGAAAIFWTFQPLRQDPAAAIEQVTDAWHLLQDDFGPLDPQIHQPHIVEASGLRAHVTGESGPAAAAFPGGALVDPAALAQGVDSSDFIERVTHALAHNWFGDEVFFAPDAALGMGEGLPEYASVVIDEAQHGERGRLQRVREFLRQYDEARMQAKEIPLGVTLMSDPPGPRRIALAKAPLFFVALEDACGGGPMRSGLKRMVSLLRGQEGSYDALRSALEESSGKDLAPLFRAWLNNDGIPDAFRARYGAPSVSAPQ
jgi:hypothetical protein